MRPRDFDLTLYDAGGHTLINNVTDPLIAFPDQDALDALIGYIQVYVANEKDVIADKEAYQHFVLHAQRAGLLDVIFYDSSFIGNVNRAVPSSVPVAPSSLVLTQDTGVVTATSNFGIGCDRYELQLKVGNTWTTVANGQIDVAEVTYEHTPGSGTHDYRVVARIGFFPGFPSAEEQIVT